MEASYQAFPTQSDEESDVVQPSSVKIHISPQVTRWSHIEDLDSFFTRIYVYYQRGGFLCILLRGVFELFKDIYLLILCLVLIYFLDYEVIFQYNIPRNSTVHGIDVKKVPLEDVFCPLKKCSRNISGLAWTCISLVTIFWTFRLIKLLYNLYHFWDIKGFYNLALQVSDEELCNVTWNEVERRVCEVQREQRMCIGKENLTELDIYHRILRSKNYMVAMMNKSLLPIHHNIPFIGSVCYLSHGLKYNIELLLFSGTWGFFENWNLKDDYRKVNKRHELAAKLQSTVTWFALGNLVFGIFIFAWQLVYFFFNYAEVLKREPGHLGLRCWSLYGRIFLRHFNELDHELEARLKRAYRPASRYMNTFSSSILNIVAQNIAFFAGSILAVLIALTIINEDVLLVEHVLTIITVLGAIFAICRALIPDENICWSQENLLIAILAEVHYLPDEWRGQAHTTQVRDQFSNFFQYKAVELLYELVSPIVTPLIFYFKLRPHCLDIVDFYRNFTVTVIGVGDVCSFSLMDTRKHGNSTWQAPEHQISVECNKQTQAENGKTELSLMHFASNNPTWQPPESAQQRFIRQINEQAAQLNSTTETTNNKDRHTDALSSVSCELNTILSQYGSQSNDNHTAASNYASSMYNSSDAHYNPMFVSQNDPMILSQQDVNMPFVHYKDANALNMNISALFLHSVHHRKINEETTSNEKDQQQTSVNTRYTSINSNPSTSSAPCGGRQSKVYESTPLLQDSPKPS